MNKAVAVAVVLFFVALGVVVGLRMDDRTVSMLGGVAIGLIIGVPCALLGLQAMKGRETPTRYAEPPPMQELPAPPATTVTNYNYYDQRKIVVMPPQRSAPGSEARRRAQEMIDAAK